MPHTPKKVLDHGHVKWIESWGSDQRIVEAARQSTQKGFLGWDPGPCPDCDGTGNAAMFQTEAGTRLRYAGAPCFTCDGKGKLLGDKKLLAYLYKHWHDSPFEFGGMIIEVKAPLFVFREWHRHRTQSYEEMSARYMPLPNENYVPELENILNRAREAANNPNKQARGAGSIVPTEAQVFQWLKSLADYYEFGQDLYEQGLDFGIPKEVARIVTPVARYSQMWAQALLRNWLAFLTLRSEATTRGMNAQWEIRQFANVVAKLVEINFPRTYELFCQGR